MEKKFEVALNKFVIEVQDKISEYYGVMKFSPEYHNHVVEVRKGSKFVKIIVGNSVHSFIEIATGNIFKPASYQAPAPHARGNIFSETNGRESMGNTQVGYFINYLR